MRYEEFGGFYSIKKIYITLFVTIIFIFTILLYDLTKFEIAIITFACLNVILIEILNTAVEQMVDIIHPKYHRGYGLVKDVLAGAVMFASIIAIVVSAFILWDPVVNKIHILAVEIQ